jgi:integrase
MFEVIPVEKQAIIEAIEKVNDYVSYSKAKSTLKAYKTDWKHFVDWCVSRNVTSKPATPETVAAYIADMATTHKVSTIERHMASISKAHGAAGFDNPASRRHTIVKETLAGIRRKNGVHQIRKAAVRVANIHSGVAALPDTNQGARDKAILLLGYIGALRRSEIVALNVDDFTFTDEGMQFVIRRSKTDQEGQGETFGVRYGVNPSTCVIRALKAWLDCSGIEEGPVFRPINRHDQIQAGRLGSGAIALIMKRLAPAMGLDADVVSGHSLRSGFITDQVAKGTPQPIIMKRSRHRSESVFRGYYREAETFAVDYASIVGL